VSTDDFTVLVVCTGNVNRSALGAALLDTWAKWYLPRERIDEVRVTSAGLRAPVGNRMGRRARAIADVLGADGSRHRAAQIDEGAIRSADLVLVSSADQREAVLGLVPAALRWTFTIREAGRIAEGLSATLPPASVDEMRDRVALLARNRTVQAGAAHDDDIIDPQGKDDEAYRLMTRQEVPPLARVARLLFGMPDTEIRAYDEVAGAAAFRFAEGEATLESTAERDRGRHQS
jgi:protein-tyrosine phosphatase